MKLFDYAPDKYLIFEETLRRLTQQQKSLPCTLFYDERGSRLFEKTCGIEEYYLARTETDIMKQHGDEMVSLMGRDCALIEFGSGSSKKTDILLNRLKAPAAYLPIDISREILLRSAQRIARRYPHLEILPICADYTAFFALPSFSRPVRRKIVYFPGSTIGNFVPSKALTFLTRIYELCGDKGALLIGVDLEKDRKILEAAYNDAQGITAEFNLNVLAHMNRELGAHFDLDLFEHRAVYNADQYRVEIYLVSLRDQHVQIGNNRFFFKKGEMVRTGYSYKYSLPRFQALAARAGFHVERTWLDDDRLFSVQFLTKS